MVSFAAFHAIWPGMPLAQRQGGGFDLGAFMSSQADGFQFDLTKTDRFFQENIGPTLADDVTEAIGLAMDSRSWAGKTLAAVVAAAAEGVVNGDFSDGTNGWGVSGTFGTVTVAAVAGRLRGTAVSGPPARVGRAIAFATIVGQTYRVSADFEAAATGANIAVSNNADFGVTLAESVLASTQRTDVIYFTATATATYVFAKMNFAAPGDVACDIDNVSVKLVGGKAGVQPTGTLKPVRQAAGAKFDGSDDNLLTTYLASATANFMFARTTVPASLAATQVIMGASGSGANRDFIAIDTNGRACAGVGSDSTTTIVGTSDLRGTEANIALTFDGTTVRLIVNGVVEYEAAQNSTPTTSIPFRIGANNNNGTAGSFYAGAIKHALVGREFITAARAQQISAALAA